MCLRSHPWNGSFVYLRPTTAVITFASDGDTGIGMTRPELDRAHMGQDEDRTGREAGEADARA